MLGNWILHLLETDLRTPLIFFSPCFNQTSIQTIVSKQEALDEPDGGAAPTLAPVQEEQPMPTPADYPNVQNITLNKGPRGLGFAIYEDRDEKGLSGIFVKDVTMGGPAKLVSLKCAILNTAFWRIFFIYANALPESNSNKKVSILSRRAFVQCTALLRRLIMYRNRGFIYQQHLMFYYNRICIDQKSERYLCSKSVWNLTFISYFCIFGHNDKTWKFMMEHQIFFYKDVIWTCKHLVQMSW